MPCVALHPMSWSTSAARPASTRRSNPFSISPTPRSGASCSPTGRCSSSSGATGSPACSRSGICRTAKASSCSISSIPSCSSSVSPIELRIVETVASERRKIRALRYCRLCVLPDSRPNLDFDTDGVCHACRTHAQRRQTDWAARERDFRALVENVKQRAAGYDCVVPVSGGKDSTWQILKCLEYGLRPLAVTWKTPARTAVGQRNLDNLVSLGVDHIDWQVSPRVEARFMLKAFERFGSTAIPMHLAIFSMPLKVAVDFAIPLVVWGENSAVEYGNAETAQAGHRLSRAWLGTYGVTHGTSAEDWVDDELGTKD